MRVIFKGLVLSVLILVLVAIGRSVYNQVLKFKEIQQAENRVTQLSKENADLKAQKGQKNDSYFLEKEARDKLGFKKPGDTLYVTQGGEKTSDGKNRTPTKNWQEWVVLLFR